MENKIFIAETEDTPVILLDKENGKIEISGRSLPEDASTFYAPIFKWLDEYIKSPHTSTEFILKLEYFNSSSAKQLLHMLIDLESLFEKNNQVKVFWHFSTSDELMESRGKELKSMVKLPFELVSF
jgi:hypothetical protein